MSTGTLGGWRATISGHLVLVSTNGLVITGFDACAELQLCVVIHLTRSIGALHTQERMQTHTRTHPGTQTNACRHTDERMQAHRKMHVTHNTQTKTAKVYRNSLQKLCFCFHTQGCGHENPKVAPYKDRRTVDNDLTVSISSARKLVVHVLRNKRVSDTSSVHFSTWPDMTFYN